VGSDQSGSRYSITTHNGAQLDEEWMGDEETYKQFLQEGRIFFPKGGDGMPRKKYYQFEREEEGQCASNWWPHEQFGHNQGANDHMTALFGRKNVFSNPKPVELISGLIKIANVRENDIILDFFSGAATSADSLLSLNAEFSKNRHFICIQLPELTYDVVDGKKVAKKDAKEAFEAGYENICEIGKERIRRAAKKIKEENPVFAGDMGFKVFKLDTSNIIPWNPDPDNIELTMRNAVENMLAGRTRQDLLYEVLLKCNLPLTLPIEENNFGQNTVYIVGAGALAICLDQSIPQTIAEEIVKLRDKYAPIVPMQVVFRDNGFTDVAKTNALHIRKQAGFDEKTILNI
jgi:adenine-specific DNA-methyltransferase